MILQVVNDDGGLVDQKLSNAFPVNAMKEGHCIWYGPCDDCGNQPVPYDGPAKALEPADEKNLKTVCPELFESHSMGTFKI